MTERISAVDSIKRAFSAKSLSDSTLLGSNAVVSRELRVALRNERSFATLGLYVAVLGAVVASQFPSDVAVGLSTNGNRGAAALGHELFLWFGFSQAFLIALILPALATGALSQERERRTLEPLLLTPLTPLQIVWGKGVGVLAFACLLLLATVPLTSMCFLLGGVSPGEVVGAYSCLLGFAACVTALGLGCAAKWENATQATLICYLLVPLLVSVLVVGSGPGVLAAGLNLLWLGVRALAAWWKKPRFVPPKLLPLWNLSAFIAIPALAILAFVVIINGWDFGIFWLVFALPYLLMASRLAMTWAADEISRRPEPRIPTPERVAEWKNEWSLAVAPPATVYFPTATGKYSYSPQTPLPTPPKKVADTYKVAAFLPENRNPVFMRDMRSGLLGKSHLLVRYSYVVVILSELAAFGWFVNNGVGQSLETFIALSSTHLWLLMASGAVFGARALAPEREQQTLPQLLTTPLSPRQIIGGKMMTVAVYTFYLWILAVPMALFLAALGEIPVAAVALFLGLEFVFGAFAMAWGLFCSMRALTVRRALGWALGGVAILMLTDSLVRTFGATAFDATANNFASGAFPAPTLASPATSVMAILISNLPTLLLPGLALQNALHHWNAQLLNGQSAPTLETAAFSAAFFVLATLLLLAKTAANFRRYLQEI